MKMRKGSRADRLRWFEKRTAAKLRLEQRKPRTAQGVNLVIPGGGTHYGAAFNGKWKTGNVMIAGHLLTDDDNGRNAPP